MVLALTAAGYLARASAWYFVGVAGAVVLLACEQRGFGRAVDVFELNDRVFAINMAFSVAFLGTTLAGFTLK